MKAKEEVIEAFKGRLEKRKLFDKGKVKIP
jgi:hypothetical protein